MTSPDYDPTPAFATGKTTHGTLRRLRANYRSHTLRTRIQRRPGLFKWKIERLREDLKPGPVRQRHGYRPVALAYSGVYPPSAPPPAVLRECIPSFSGLLCISERDTSRSAAGRSVPRRREAKFTVLEENSGHDSRGSVGGRAKRSSATRGPTNEPGNGVRPAARCENGDLGALDQPSKHTPSTRQRAARRRRRRSQCSRRPPQTRPRPRRRTTRTLKIGQNVPISLDFAHFH